MVHKLSRRQFLLTSGITAATTVLMHGCGSPSTTTDNQQPGPVASIETPEVTTAKLGFIALTDAAPLII
ncbi:MAG: twin-arginine translocation signal domain-containing protein, partial [Gloeomargarita sp. GMQP_bins_44]